MKDKPHSAIGPIVASAAVGVAIGVVAIVGISTLSDAETVSKTTNSQTQDALLGDPEYGSRNAQ